MANLDGYLPNGGVSQAELLPDHDLSRVEQVLRGICESADRAIEIADKKVRDETEKRERAILARSAAIAGMEELERVKNPPMTVPVEPYVRQEMAPGEWR